jgi:hypothetical protein
MRGIGVSFLSMLPLFSSVGFVWSVRFVVFSSFVCLRG